MIPERALILSAGRGERLRPHTEERPKTMMPIGGRPLLEYHIVLLREHGIRELAVNLHHRPEAVIEYFGDGSHWGVSILYSLEDRLMGTAGAAKRIEGFLGAGRFVVVYGDNLFADDLGPMFEAHDRMGACTTVAVIEGPDPCSGGVAVVGPGWRVSRFIEKPRPDQVLSRLVNAGVYVMEPEVLGFVPGDRPSDFGRDVLPALIEAGQRVYAWKMRGYLSGIDTPELYQKAQRDLAAGWVSHPLVGAR